MEEVNSMVEGLEDVPSLEPPQKFGGGAVQAEPRAASPEIPAEPAGGQSLPEIEAQLHTHWEMRKVIQYRLFLLLHAHNCLRRQEFFGESFQCMIKPCENMKGVLNHVLSCEVGWSCAVPLCKSSTEILGHWKSCVKRNCRLCGPFRNHFL